MNDSIWPNSDNQKVKWSKNSASYGAFVPYRRIREVVERQRGLDILGYADWYVQLCNSGRFSNPTRRVDVMIDFDEDTFTLTFNYAFTDDFALEINREERALSYIAAIDVMERKQYIRSVIERLIRHGELALAEKKVNLK